MLEINKLQKNMKISMLNCSMKDWKREYIYGARKGKTDRKKVQHLKALLRPYKAGLEEKSLSSGKNLWS